MTAEQVEPRIARCPICRAPYDEAFRPFCSARCADVDLGRWLTGTYAIAGGATDEEADAGITPTDQRDDEE